MNTEALPGPPCYVLCVGKRFWQVQVPLKCIQPWGSLKTPFEGRTLRDKLQDSHCQSKHKVEQVFVQTVEHMFLGEMA